MVTEKIFGAHKQPSPLLAVIKKKNFKKKRQQEITYFLLSFLLYPPLGDFSSYSSH